MSIASALPSGALGHPQEAPEATKLTVRVAGDGKPVSGAVAAARKKGKETTSLKGLSRGEATIKVVPNGFDPASKVVDLQRSKQSVEIKVTRRSPPP